MLKELLRALYAIIDAIKNKNNSGEGGGEQSDYKIKIFSYKSEPAGLIARKDGEYIGKCYSIEEIFASTPQQIVEIFDIDIEGETDVTFYFLYRNYDDVKEGVMTQFNMEINTDTNFQEIITDSSWNVNPIIRSVELDGETYYFLDPTEGELPIIQDR